MIRINVLHDHSIQKLNFEIQKFEKARESKSFSERHPELLRMFNCKVCGRRHRLSHTCAQNYAFEITEEPSLRHQFPKRRHRNAIGLQDLERALKIYREDKVYFPNNTEEEDAKLGKSSLSRALNELRKERKARRRKFFQITRESRRVNRA